MMKLIIPTCALIFLLTLQFNAQSQDHVIVHTVEQGQTIYSISKLYNLTPAEIKNQNPLVDDSYAIKPGQLLRVKMAKGNESDQVVNNLAKQPKIHIVQSKETLYGISRDYNVKIDDIKKWNELGNTQLRVNQQLVVGWRYSNQNEDVLQENVVADRNLVLTESNVNQPSQAVIYSTPIEQPKQTQIINQAPVTQPTKPVPSSLGSTDKQTLLRERFSSDVSTKAVGSLAGPAIFFSTDNEMLSTRYYGLFSDAKVGSIVKVKNLINNNEVYVKVIGSLPDTKENYGSMIKLTTAAKQKLAVNDNKIRVEVTYAQ